MIEKFALLSRQVFKNLGLFMKRKQAGDDLFDRLTVSILFVCKEKDKIWVEHKSPLF